MHQTHQGYFLCDQCVRDTDTKLVDPDYEYERRFVYHD
jgi:hypothetical protein